MSYTHLTVQQRSVLEHLDRRGHRPAEIARQLGRSRSTISRELRRNRPTDRCRYLAQRAGLLAGERRAAANARRAKLLHKPLARVVKAKLRERWSPGGIAGRLEHEHGERDPAMRVCGMTIYRWLRRDREQGGTLERGLPRRGKGRKPNGSRGKRVPAPGRRRLEERPPGATDRSQFGHWEIDTIEGAHKGSYLVSLVDRKSRYTLLGHAPDKRSATINRVVIGMMIRLGLGLRRTITSDNGREFNAYRELEKELGVRFYFADPNSPWQRGTNEQTNGLVRLFLPKGSDFARVSRARLARLEATLNNRAKACLNYRTPAEVINLPAVALRV